MEAIVLQLDQETANGLGDEVSHISENDFVVGIEPGSHLRFED